MLNLQMEGGGYRSLEDRGEGCSGVTLAVGPCDVARQEAGKKESAASVIVLSHQFPNLFHSCTGSRSVWYSSTRSEHTFRPML